MTLDIFSSPPWSVVEATEHHGFYVEDVTGNTVCDLYFKDDVGFFHHPYNTADPARENAFIVAAAPAMLELLKDLRDHLEVKNTPKKDATSHAIEGKQIRDRLLHIIHEAERGKTND